MNRVVLLILAWLLSIGVNTAFGQQQSWSSPRYDGHWWVSVTHEEQYGYVDGATDCAGTELQYIKLKDRGPYSHSVEEDIEFVTAYYKNHPDRMSELAFYVSLKSSKVRSLVLRPQGGEEWNEPHGYWDGGWWIESPASRRLGFVEGYLACHAENPLKSKARFSQPPSYYVEQINHWYHLDASTPAPREIIEKKIANVLYKFRDMP